MIVKDGDFNLVLSFLLFLLCFWLSSQLLEEESSSKFSEALLEMPLARHLWLHDLEERGDDVGDKLRGAIKLLMISVNCALCFSILRRSSVGLLGDISKSCSGKGS